MINHYEKIKNKKVLITGGLGFVGQNLVKVLVQNYDCEVIVVDDCSNSSVEVIKEILDKVQFHQISVLDTGKLFPLFQDVNYIFHLACVQISQSSLNPVLDIRVNAESTLNILEYLRHNQFPSFERFVYTSSCSIYGSSTKLSIEEDDPKSVLSHYASTKLLGENYTNIYNINYEIPTAVVRYSNVYGYGQSPRNPYCGVLGKFIHNGLTNEALKIFGDGEQTRDYTFITDAINATILAAVHPRAIGDSFNVGTSIETSVNKLVEIIKNEISDLIIEYIPERDIDNIRRRAVSIAKIYQKLGWLPQYNIKRGIIETLRWYKTTL